MKEAILTYQGYIDKKFCFKNEQITLSFHKSRRELIDQFDLMNKNNIGKSFVVKYFVLQSEFNDTYILSDLKLFKL